jgi:hypothetical protein
MSKVEDLEKRIAQLEAQLAAQPKPVPEPPPVPKYYAPYDWTERMSPPVRLTGRERYREGQTIEEANNEFRKNANPVGTLRPLAEWLAAKEGAAAPAPAPAPVATTIPIGPQRDIRAVDAVALGFERRERAEELAKLVDTMNKLKGL